MLEIKNVTKKFGSKTAVDNLSLKVNEGEVYGFIGPNGAGKTTTIKMITGLIAPTQGEIYINGKDIEKEPEASKRLLGYIPDDPFILEKITGREFLYLSGELFGVDPAKTDEHIKAMAPGFNIEDILDSYFADYSRGNKQKTAIIAASLHDPKVLIIDEPIVGLDPQSAKAAQKVFTDFAENGGAILMSTHTLSFAQQICTRIGVINQSHLVAEGTMKELQDKIHNKHAKLEETYLKLTEDNANRT